MLSHRQEKPGFAAFVAFDGTAAVAEWSARVPTGDITGAELYAVLEGLKWAAMNDLRRVKVFTDSQASVYAVWGACRNPEKYRSILKQIRALLRKVKSELEWIPRRENCRADRVCRRASWEYEQKFPQVLAG